MPPRPHHVSFLIAGAQKCGTTALDAYLRHHPELEMPRVKEAHYFDREGEVDWRQPDARALESLYDGPVGRLRGESTPVTLYWTPAHYRVLRYNPEMRFIILMRDPADRAWSQWRMSRGRGLEPLDFSEAIRGGRTRVLDGDGPMGLSRHFSYVERGYYARQIEQLASLFPLDSMLFLTQDMVSERIDEALDRVACFLGVSGFAPATPVRMNVSAGEAASEMSAVDRAYLNTLYEKDLARLRTLTGLDLSPRRQD